MNLVQFNSLNDTEQAETLLEKGVCVAELFYKEFKILLYQVNRFYVEVYYHITYDMIQGFRGFESMTALDPYLQSIDITELELC